MTDFIVDPLVEFCVDVIGEIGYLGIFLLMLVESANIPMPSEATMLFAGFKVEEGDLTLLGITAAGVLGNVVGSWAGYAIGYYGRTGAAREVPDLPRQPEADGPGRGLVRALRRRHRLLHADAPDRPDLHLHARRRRAHEPRASSRIYTALGCIPWVLMLGFIGVKVGENWEEWRDKLHYFDYVVLAGLIGARGLRRSSGGAGQRPRAQSRPLRGRARAGLDDRGDGPTHRLGPRALRSGPSRARPSCCRSRAPPT